MPCFLFAAGSDDCDMGGRVAGAEGQAALDRAQQQPAVGSAAPHDEGRCPDRERRPDDT